MQAHAALRAVRKALIGHEQGRGLKTPPTAPAEGSPARPASRMRAASCSDVDAELKRARKALQRAERLLARLRAIVEDVDTVVDADPPPSPFADDFTEVGRARTAERERARVRASVERTKARLASELGRRPRT